VQVLVERPPARAYRLRNVNCHRALLSDPKDAPGALVFRWLGNPQIRGWGNAEEEARLIRRWLASASLKVFFQLISDHALDHQWRYREAFWSACLAKGLISDACLTLAEAQKTGRLQEFIAQEEARGVGPVSQADLDRALSAVIKGGQSEDQTSRSPSRDGPT
jgi:hypothetical protein